MSQARSFAPKLWKEIACAKEKILWLVGRPAGRPAWREAHRTIYWDKLNGRQSGAGARKHCALEQLRASCFRRRRFSTRDIKRQRRGERIEWTRLRLTRSFRRSIMRTCFFFICNIIHQNILFFQKACDKRFKFSSRNKNKMVLVTAFITL